MKSLEKLTPTIYLHKKNNFNFMKIFIYNSEKNIHKIKFIIVNKFKRWSSGPLKKYCIIKCKQK